MKGEDFEDYLADEGLTAIAEMRKSSERRAAGRERYSKWAKAIVDVGDELGPAVWAENAASLRDRAPDHPNRRSARGDVEAPGSARRGALAG
jgi:hypothetical protein